MRHVTKQQLQRVHRMAKLPTDRLRPAQDLLQVARKFPFAQKRQELRGNLKEIPVAGEGSNRKLVHPKYAGAVTVSGKTGDDAKRYQEKQVAQAIEMVSK